MASRAEAPSTEAQRARLPGLGTVVRAALSDYYFNSMRLVAANLVWGVALALIVLAGIVSPLLVFRVGASHAANLLLTTRTVKPEEAQRIGLVHEVTSADLNWVRAHELAQEIARSAPEAIQLTKKLLNETIGEHLGTLLSAGAAASATARTTEAAAEGLAAFLEKREPQWQ